jgi:hypothetical protein
MNESPAAASNSADYFLAQACTDFHTHSCSFCLRAFCAALSMRIRLIEKKTSRINSKAASQGKTELADEGLKGKCKLRSLIGRNAWRQT